MKKLIAVAALVACASGCVMTGGKIESALTLNVQAPESGFVDNSVKPAKVGKATATGLICFCEGDASLKAAMDNGGITKVHHVDYSVKNILGIVAEYTTIVYGE